MIKANSLLYAVYVCLIVSILCGALLYYSSLYNMLNQYYNSREDLYVQNQSAFTYALCNGDTENSVVDEDTGIKSDCIVKQHGLLDVVIVKSSLKNDTIASAHFTGPYANNKTAVFLSNFSNDLSYSGNVRLIGDKHMPSKFIEEKFLNNYQNNLTSIGTITLSNTGLPEINPDFNKVFDESNSKRFLLENVSRSNDSIYFNSFLNSTIDIEVSGTTLSNTIIKGNFILHAKDSLIIANTAVLEDVIVKAPIVKIAKGFKGNLQVFSSKKIEVDENVQLSYPSVLCLNNPSSKESTITINNNSSVYGAIVLFGSPLMNVDQNRIILNEKTLLVGDIYCTGELMLNGKVYGAVYTNRFFSKTKSSTYENCIINAEIDITKRPNYFISVPLFKDKKELYGAFKKVL